MRNLNEHIARVANKNLLWVSYLSLEEEIDSRIEELNTKMVYQKVKTTWTIT
jgi:hypothetical protein